MGHQGCGWQKVLDHRDTSHREKLSDVAIWLVPRTTGPAAMLGASWFVVGPEDPPTFKEEPGKLL